MVDRIEPTVAKYAVDWPAWGYRKIGAIAATDVHQVGSPSSVKRAMARRGLLQPVRYQAERRQLAAARREVFVEPPVRRNRVWQADFSTFETTSEGTWALCGVVDYAAKIALVCPVTTTQGTTDLIAALAGPPSVTAEALLGRPLIEDCIDETTGEIVAARGRHRQRPRHEIHCVGALVRRPEHTSPTCAPATAPRTPTASSNAGSRP